MSRTPQAQPEQPSFNFLQFFKDNYNAQQFQEESRKNAKDIWGILPLFFKQMTNCNSKYRIVVILKTMIFISSFFFTILNDSFINSPSLVITSFQVWRIITAPFVTSSFFEYFLIMPYFMGKYMYSKEYYKGSLYVCFYFFVNSLSYQFLVCLYSLPFMLNYHAFEQLSTSGLFSLLLIEAYIALMKEPERLMNFFIFQCPQQHILVLIYMLFWLVLKENLISVLAAASIGYLITKNYGLSHQEMNGASLISVENKLSGFCIFIQSKLNLQGYISGSEALKNQAQNSDNLPSFDRQQMTNRNRSQNIRLSNIFSSSQQSGVTLGGSKSKSESVLVSEQKSQANSQTEASTSGQVSERSNTQESEEDVEEDRKLN